MALQTNYNIRYCFGAPYVCNELAGDIVAVGAFGHPAFLKEQHFENLKGEIACCTSHYCNNSIHIPGPLFLSCSEIDHTFDTASRRKALDILQNKKKRYQLQLFSGVEHGFALRGNMENAYERKSFVTLSHFEDTNTLLGYVKEESLRGIIKWFDYWLSP